MSIWDKWKAGTKGNTSKKSLPAPKDTGGQRKKEYAPEQPFKIDYKHARTERLQGIGKQDITLRLFIDATGSMDSTIAQVKNDIVQIAQMINEECPNHKIQYCVVAYRDHSDGADIMHVSEVTKDPKEIEKFLGKIDAFGGDDMPEAIGYALERNEQEPTDIAILFADAPSHGDAVKIAKRYGKRGTPIHALVVGNSPKAVREFAEIAKATNGVSGLLDASETKHIVVAAVVQFIGGSSGIQAFAEKYNLLEHGKNTGAIVKKLIALSPPPKNT